MEQQSVDYPDVKNQIRFVWNLTLAGLVTVSVQANVELSVSNLFLLRQYGNVNQMLGSTEDLLRNPLCSLSSYELKNKKEWNVKLPVSDRERVIRFRDDEKVDEKKRLIGTRNSTKCVYVARNALRFCYRIAMGEIKLYYV